MARVRRVARRATGRGVALAADGEWRGRVDAAAARRRVGGGGAAGRDGEGPRRGLRVRGDGATVAPDRRLTAQARRAREPATASSPAVIGITRCVRLVDHLCTMVTRTFPPRRCRGLARTSRREPRDPPCPALSPALIARALPPCSVASTCTSATGPVEYLRIRCAGSLSLIVAAAEVEVQGFEAASRVRGRAVNPKGYHGGPSPLGVTVTTVEGCGGRLLSEILTAREPFGPRDSDTLSRASAD